MKSHVHLAVLSLLLGGYSLASAQEPEPAAREFFTTEIKPLLTARCGKCHGESPGKGGFSFATRAELLKGGDSGAAIKPGKPAESPVISAIKYQDDDLRMPPDGKLPDVDIAKLERWVREGAVWSGNDVSLPATESSTRTTDSHTAEQRNFWSFQPVRDILPPAVNGREWPKTPIDNFILACLEERHLSPAVLADKRILIRRATFDLTGLPPTPSEIAGFLADESPTAFATVVERLLASPHYGERWGRHWLDVVRYADARDLIQLPAESDFREIWRYRDWVVSAFNQDLPYDELIRRQIAGDLLQPADPRQIDKDSLIATGMLALADFVPGDVDKKRMIADYVNDEIDVVGRGILGITLACARCHDHKFDPISTEDYYAMAGIFFSTRLIPGPTSGNTPLVRAALLSPDELEAVDNQIARDKQRVTELVQQVQILGQSEQLTRLDRRVARETPRYLLAAWDLLHASETPDQSAITELAANRELDEAILGRWLTYLRDRPHPILTSARDATERIESERLLRVLREELSALTSRRNHADIVSPTARMLAENELLRFHADDPRISTNSAAEVTLWPDHGGLSEDAVRVLDTSGPALIKCTDLGRPIPVVRFNGHQSLQAPRTVPANGSLFAVFRFSEQAAAGQRLVGWEDSSVGKHGLGLMFDADRKMRVVLRRDGATHDVSMALPAASELQLVSITWGSSGATVHHNGEEVVTSQSDSCVSSGSEISALRIGGPGSGSAGQFCGDLAELRVYGVPLDAQARAAVEAELRQRWLTPTEPSDEMDSSREDLLDELTSLRGPFWANEAERDRFAAAEPSKELIAMRDELESLQKKPAPKIPQAVVAQEGGPADTEHAGFHDAAVYVRGNPARPSQVVPRGFPRILVGEHPPAIREGSGRRELAQWLTRADNPLTARVMVNRIWQHHFGEGLVRTPSNFGVNGERPSHPELLDYLAKQFVASGWSVKAMHRMIMLSSAYQQSSRATKETIVADPENRLLGRMHRRRLDAEEIRDNLLAVAGRLDSTAGGPGFLDINVPRRSLYLMSVRSGAKAAEFATLFDGANCSGVVEQRGESTSAPQALFMLNDPFVMDLAAALAKRVTGEITNENNDARIARLYEIVAGRAPTLAEIEIGHRFLNDRATADAWSRFCHVVLCTNELVYVD